MTYSSRAFAACDVEIDFHRFNQPTVNDPAMAALALTFGISELRRLIG